MFEILISSPSYLSGSCNWLYIFLGFFVTNHNGNEASLFFCVTTRGELRAQSNISDEPPTPAKNYKDL